jgi:DNA-binding NtrC family response regulator
MKILLIEDTSEQISIAIKLLQENGHQFLVAHNLEEATLAIKTGTFDGALTDLHLPEKDGLETTPPCGFAVLALCAEKALPVVVVSDINHHFAVYAVIVVEALAKLHPSGKIPFVMDSKNWSQGLELLAEVVK